MREPVITPSGITYDRKDIEEHLQVKCSDLSFSLNVCLFKSSSEYFTK